jgi:hypothetical protein
MVEIVLSLMNLFFAKKNYFNNKTTILYILSMVLASNNTKLILIIVILRILKVNPKWDFLFSLVFLNQHVWFILLKKFAEIVCRLIKLQVSECYPKSEEEKKPFKDTTYNNSYSLFNSNCSYSNIFDEYYVRQNSWKKEKKNKDITKPLIFGTAGGVIGKIASEKTDNCKEPFKKTIERSISPKIIKTSFLGAVTGVGIEKTFNFKNKKG